jgi:hypothetical protein
MRSGCTLGMEAYYAELFSAYEEPGAVWVLLPTADSPGTPGVLAVEAADHAAANSAWISYAGLVQAGHPPAGVVMPDRTWTCQCDTGRTGSPSPNWSRAPTPTLGHGDVLHAPSPADDCPAEGRTPGGADRADQPILHAAQTPQPIASREHIGGSRNVVIACAVVGLLGRFRRPGASLPLRGCSGDDGALLPAGPACLQILGLRAS